MKTLKRFLSVFLASALFALSSSFAFADSEEVFPDLENHWSKDFVMQLYDQDVIGGYANGNFGPNDPVTRAQFAKMAVLAFLGQTKVTEEPADTTTFSDVKKSEWFVNYVYTAYLNKIIIGYSNADGLMTGKFGPNDLVNRAEAAKIVTIAAGLKTNIKGGPHFIDVPTGSWFYPYVETAYNNSVVDGKFFGNYAPGSDLTRGEAAKMIILGQNPVPREKEPPEPPVPPVTKTSLAVAVGSDTPNEDIVVAGDSSVELSKFKFTASGEDFMVKSLSVNNMQSGVKAANFGDYDNNIDHVTIVYKDKNENTQSKTASVHEGTAKFSGLDFFVPKNEDRSLTAFATINTIGDGAVSGEYVRLNLAFNNFEAVAQGSGQVFGPDKMDGSVNDDEDFDFGSIVFTDGDGTFDMRGSQNVSASQNLGATLDLTLDSDKNSNNENKLPVGTLICVDDDDSESCNTEDIYIVESWPSSTLGTSDSVTLKLVDNAGDGVYDDDDPLLYGLPGAAYLTAVNKSHVHASKPTIRAHSTSPSGSHNESVSDSVLILNIDADGDDVKVNPGVEFATCLQGTGSAVVNNAHIFVDGSSCEATSIDTNGDSVVYDGTGNLDDYSYVSFWFRWEDESDSAVTLNPTDLHVYTANLNNDIKDQERIVTSNNIYGQPEYFVENTWYFVKDVPMPSGTDSNDNFIGISVHDEVTMDEKDKIFIDRLMLYNQKVEFELSSNNSFDLSYDHSILADKSPVKAELKDGSQVLATGYIDMVASDENKDGIEENNAHSNMGVVTFIPIASQGSIKVTGDSARKINLVINSENLIFTQADVSNSLEVLLQFGSSSDGNVTPGGLWWYDGYKTIKWLGDTEKASLVGDELLF